ncbi:MAG: hypothetical protein JWM11_256, partial [Planctomycetaceae bacterium]|nr:hypothetical protein [Planctomycetaceae bacterium]
MKHNANSFDLIEEQSFDDPVRQFLFSSHISIFFENPKTLLLARESKSLPGRQTIRLRVSERLAYRCFLTWNLGLGELAAKLVRKDGTPNTLKKDERDYRMKTRRSEAAATGAGALKILETPLTVIDFETTGLDAGIDRVVEVCVARIDPGQPPKIILDTLINPGRPVDATFIHGITDADVRHAPRFADIAGDLVEALSGSVVTAYNVYFDLKFLRDELGRCGVVQVPPHLCLMYLKPLLGLGVKCGLREACRELGVLHTGEHYAAVDVAASAKILVRYLEEIKQ